MAVMKRFLFWFSVRFGTVLIGIISLIQAAIWLMISVITIENQDDVRDFLQQVIDSLEIDNKHFLSFAQNPQMLLICMAIFASIYLISSVLIIAAALMCKYQFLYPFLILDLLYIQLNLLLLVMLMINFKKRGYTTGTLILYSHLFAGILLLLIYMWACVMSLLQIINELRCEIIEHRIMLHDGTRQMKRMIDMRYEAPPNNYVTTE